MTNKPKLRWYQYSLRSLFILMTLVACASSWYAYEMNEAAKRRAAIEKIEELEGLVRYYDASDVDTYGEAPGWFSWLRKLHGDEHLGDVVVVALRGPRITDAEMVHLKDLTKLEWLEFRAATQITDAGLVHLKGLTNLKVLWLDGSPITDAGLVHLKGLTTLEVLWLDGSHITDAGLVNLKGLTRLGTLMLTDTKVTDEGVKKLQEALPNCKIHH